VCVHHPGDTMKEDDDHTTIRSIIEGKPCLWSVEELENDDHWGERIDAWHESISRVSVVSLEPFKSKTREAEWRAVFSDRKESKVLVENLLLTLPPVADSAGGGSALIEVKQGKAEEEESEEREQEQEADEREEDRFQPPVLVHNATIPLHHRRQVCATERKCVRATKDQQRGDKIGVPREVSTSSQRREVGRSVVGTAHSTNSDPSASLPCRLGPFRRGENGTKKRKEGHLVGRGALSVLVAGLIRPSEGGSFGRGSRGQERW
jgi:hypothetical protein